MKTKEQQIMDYLNKNVFGPVLNSEKSSNTLKQAARMTIIRMENRDAKGMVHFFWSAIAGTERSIRIAELAKKEGFSRFEEVYEEFRVLFDDKFLRS